jgi:hypothetical protein
MANKTWQASAGSGNWSTAGDWIPSAPIAGDAVFIGSSGNAAGFVVTEDSTLAINTLTMAGKSGATTTLQVTPSATLSVSGNITLGKFTVINGTGALIANSAISGGGSIAASNGLLDVMGIGSIASGGAVLSIGNSVASTLKLDLGGGVTSAAAISISNANQTLEIGNSSALTVNKAENITNGTIRLDGGTLTDASGVTIGSGATLMGQGTAGAITVSRGVITQTGGPLTLSSITGSGTVNGAPQITGAITASGGTLDLTGAPTFGSLAIATATASVLKIDGILTSGAITISNTRQTLEIGNAGALTISAAESIASGTVKLDGGALTDASGVAVTSGSVIGSGTIAANTALSGAGTVKASGGTLDLKGTVSSGPILAIATAAGSDLLIDGTATAAAAISINNVNQTLEIGSAGSLTISAAENITNGTIKLDGGTLTDASAVTIGNGATLTGKGKAATAISGAGTVTASGGVLDLAGNVTATKLAISTVAGSVMQLAGTVASGTNVTFQGQTGVLELSDVVNGVVQQFNGKITGLNVGSSATIPTNAVNIQATVTKATLSGNTIIVSNGATTVATLSLSATPATGSNAVAEADATLGGYDVFLTNAPSTAPTVSWSPGLATGAEGSAIALGTITPTGTTLTSVLVSGIPVGATLSDGTHSFKAAAASTSVNILGWNDATLSITATNDANISLSVQSTDSLGNVSTAATEAVTVDPLAPAVAPVAVSGLVGQPIALILGISANSLAGDTNSLSSVTISGIPSGSTLSNTAGNTLSVSGGSITFTATQLAGGVLNGLAITPTVAGSFTLNVAAIEQDAQGDLSGTATGSETVTGTSASLGTISTSIAGPFTLSAATNPLTITSTGTVTATGSGVDGIDGSSAASWTITNNGVVSSSGGNGILLLGPGTINNAGSLSGTEGVALRTGGSLTNSLRGAISASGAIGGGSGIGSGIYITGALGTVSNYGAVVGAAYGVAMARGGTVTNSNSIAGGEDGIIIQGGAGTIANTGSVTASVDDGIGLFAGGSVSNAAGGFISGANIGAGIFITGAFGSVANSGTVTTSGTRFGILLTSGGSVTNAVSASIAGDVAAVLVNGQPGTITNSGSISATGAAGVDLETGGTVDNGLGGSVKGSSFGAFITGGSGLVTNAGLIASAIYGAVALEAGGTVTNVAGGSISGGSSGVYFGIGAAGTVTNFGSIGAVGVNSAGVDLALGGSVINNAGGSISGTGFGVFATGAAGTLTNSGTVTGSHGVGMEAGGNITNQANAAILGQSAGVLSQGGAATLSNFGSIAANAAGGAGADIEAGGSVTNNVGATLSGAAFGVFITGGPATVTNAGTISGGSYAVKFSGSAANRLVVDPGAVFSGAIGGGSGVNTVELASGTGSVGGVNAGTFFNFQDLAVDNSAIWTLDGANSVPTVVNDGTVAVAGSLDVSTAIDPSSDGLFQLDGGSTFEVAAALGTQTQMNFLASSELVIDNFGSFGVNIGSLGYAGPQLQDFGSGDTIDLRQFSSSSDALAYDASTGLLQISNGATQLASLEFQNSSLKGTTFQATTDGSTGTLITRA